MFGSINLQYILYISAIDDNKEIYDAIKNLERREVPKDDIEGEDQLDEDMNE